MQRRSELRALEIKACAGREELFDLSGVPLLRGVVNGHSLIVVADMNIRARLNEPVDHRVMALGEGDMKRGSSALAEDVKLLGCGGYDFGEFGCTALGGYVERRPAVFCHPTKIRPGLKQGSRGLHVAGLESQGERADGVRIGVVGEGSCGKENLDHVHMARLRGIVQGSPVIGGGLVRQDPKCKKLGDDAWMSGFSCTVKRRGAAWRL